MNLQLANVLNDVSGMTGQAIIKAILAGERDPHKLAALRDQRVKASENQIAQSLEGHWQDDLLFVLKQEQDAYEFCQQQMAECDRRLERYLEQREDRSQGIKQPERETEGAAPSELDNPDNRVLLAFLFILSCGLPNLHAYRTQLHRNRAAGSSHF